MNRSQLCALIALFSFAACSTEEPTPSAPATTVVDQGTGERPAQSPASPQSERPVAGASDAVLFEQHEFTDSARGKMPAYRLLVPKGWEVEGGVTKVSSAYSMIPSFSQFSVRAPDGRGAMFWGMLEFGYADGFAYPVFTPFDGRPFFPLQPSLGEYWLRTFEHSPAPGVTKLEIVSEVVLPEATKRVREQLAPLHESTVQENRQLATIGESKEFHAEARQLVIRYDQDGKRIEATIFATWRHAIYRFADGSIRAAMWNLDHMYAVFAPVGTNPLEDPVLATIVRSRQEVPEWQAAIQRWYLEKNQQIIAEGNARIAAAARAAATTRTSQSQDVLDISFQGWKSRNAANDAGHAASINGIHERTTYVNPSGTTVDLPSYYRNVYTDGQGNYVLHDDANYEINTDPTFNGRDWQRIEAQR